MPEDIRQYSVQSSSTQTFGRVLCSARDHHFIVDGPVQNGCPGEAITPAEVFLAAVAACGVELTQVIAKQQNINLKKVDVSITGIMNKSKPVRNDVALFNSVHLAFRLSGVTQKEGEQLVEAFKGK
jgi:uncharacterized OsmC-like protein